MLFYFQMYLLLIVIKKFTYFFGTAKDTEVTQRMRKEKEIYFEIWDFERSKNRICQVKKIEPIILHY